MVRGRKGLIEQSERKPKLQEDQEKEKERICHIFMCQKAKKKIFLPEEAVETLKHMNPQQLFNFLLPKEDWHIKDSTVNASGSSSDIIAICKFTFVDTSVKKKNISCGKSRFSHEIFEPPFHLFLPLSSLELHDMLYLCHLSAKKGAKDR